MIVRKILLTLVAIVATAAASGVFVVAAAYGLFALVRPPLGAAGAAGVVCLAAALLIGAVGLVAALQARAVRRKAITAPSLMHQIFELAKEQPIVSAGALIGAVTLAIRNPAVLTSVIKAFLNQKRTTRSKT